MNKIAGVVVGGVLAATLAGAEEQKRNRIAPADVYAISPGLGQMTDDVLFGKVWKRDDLATRDRSLVTISSLIATGKTAQLAAHVRLGLDNGLKPVEIGEIANQLAFYTGWPNAISAATEIKRVFDERDIPAVTDIPSDPIALDPQSEVTRKASVEKIVGAVSRNLTDDTNDLLFAKLWTRSELSPRDRSIATMAALISIGQPEQLSFHANRAMDNGLTPAQAGEVVSHLAYYAGWPRAMSAVPVLNKIIEQR